MFHLTLGWVLCSYFTRLLKSKWFKIDGEDSFQINRQYNNKPVSFNNVHTYLYTETQTNTCPYTPGVYYLVVVLNDLHITHYTLHDLTGLERRLQDGHLRKDLREQPKNVFKKINVSREIYIY